MFTDERPLPPPWIACPDIERGSIGWRMGYGEFYLGKWRAWYAALSDAERAEYLHLFPEPITWCFPTDQPEHNCYRRGDFCILRWREGGLPAYTAKRLPPSADFRFFWGHRPAADGTITQSCFSQWWKSDFFSVTTTYCCMEQYMMAEKARLFDDEDALAKILSCDEPMKIKALGRKVRHFDEAIWDEAKYSIVLNGNYRKFAQNPALRRFLLSTGDSVLVEASPYDAVWGIGLAANDDRARHPAKWRGQNLLGFALMEVRDEIRRVFVNEQLCAQV